MPGYVDNLKLEKGKVTLNSIPVTFTLLKSVYYQQKELKKVLGDNWKKLAYERGRDDSRDALQAYLTLLRNEPEMQKLMSSPVVEAIKFLMHQYNTLGLGRVELITEDLSKPLFVFRLHFSPIALVYLEHEQAKESVCYHFGAFCAGAIGLFCPGIEARETKCMAKGDPYCEFVASIPKR